MIEVLDYIKFCFIDFIDSGSSLVKIDVDVESHSIYGLDIVLPEPLSFTYLRVGYSNLSTIGDYHSIDSYIDNERDVLNSYENIKSCLDRVSIRYPDLVFFIKKNSSFDMWIYFVIKN